MRPSPQREPGVTGAPAGSGSELVAELVRAHEESIALVGALLRCQERGGGGQTDADTPAALTAATDAWAGHVMYLHGLLAMTDALIRMPVPLPAGERATSPAATGLARSRSRGGCSGRPG